MLGQLNNLMQKNNLIQKQLKSIKDQNVNAKNYDF